MKRSINWILVVFQSITPFTILMTGCLMFCLVCCGISAAEPSSGSPDSTLGDKLLHAVASGDLSESASLLNQGANPNALDKNGISVLIYTAELDDIYTARLLLEKGAVVDFKEAQYGMTALMKAAVFAGDDFVTLLLDKGAKVDTATSRGGNALLEALFVNRFKSAEVLLKRGANPNFMVNGLPIMSSCIAYGKDDFAIKLLKKYGAKPNLPATSGPYAGKTALQIATDLGKADMVTLLKAKAKVPLQAVNMPPIETVGMTLNQTGCIRKMEGNRIQFEPITANGIPGKLTLFTFDQRTVFRKMQGDQLVDADNPQSFVNMPMVSITRSMMGGRRLIKVTEGGLMMGEGGLIN